MNKTKVRNHFLYYWYVYLIALVATIFIVTWGVNSIIAPKKNEKINLFVGAIKVDKTLVTEVINNDQDASLLEVSVNHVSPMDSNFVTYLSTLGVTDTDLMIVPDAYLTNDFLGQYCMNITECADSLNQIYNFSYLERQVSSYVDSKYGILVYDKENKYSLLNGYITYNEDNASKYYAKYYLVFNKNTVNMSSIKKVSDQGSDHLTQALKNLFQNEK